MGEAFFFQYETAELKLLIRGEGKPLEGYDKVVVSFDQGAQRGMHHADFAFDAGSAEVDVEESTITLYLGQEDTGQFAAAPARVQVNIHYTDQERDVTLEGRVEVRENIYKRVM